jgi:DNA-binding response OmpR family regulator
MSKILLLEDSEESQVIILNALGREHQITVSESVEQACSLLRQDRFELILLDLTLPERDGYSLLSELETSFPDLEVPVICISSREKDADKVAAFSLGAEDYLVKPFSVAELRARVNAKLRKAGRRREASTAVTIGDLRLNRDSWQAAVRSTTGWTDLGLTPTEFKLLFHLASQPDRVYTREQLLTAVWNNDAEVFDRAVDVHICSLRRKLEVSDVQIKAVRGVGYTCAVGARRKPAAA